jgi:hypothetical protein
MSVTHVCLSYNMYVCHTAVCHGRSAPILEREELERWRKFKAGAERVPKWGSEGITKGTATPFWNVQLTSEHCTHALSNYLNVNSDDVRFDLKKKRKSETFEIKGHGLSFCFGWLRFWQGWFKLIQCHYYSQVFFYAAIFDRCIYANLFLYIDDGMHAVNATESGGKQLLPAIA